LNGLTFLRNTLSIITQIASNKGNNKTTIIVPIFAHPNNERYANANPKDIVPTSLISHKGRNSIAVPITVTPANNRAHQIVALIISSSIPFIVGYNGFTTRVSNDATVRNQRAELHEASPYTPSNRLIALVHNPNHATVKMSEPLIPNRLTRDPKFSA
jgi:hypothetical protein